MWLFCRMREARPIIKKRRLVFSAALLFIFSPGILQAEEEAPISLRPGEIRGGPMCNYITRVAVGSPEIVDVTILSPTEVLLQGKKAGTTNLILWEGQQQRTTTVTVQEQAPEELMNQLRRVLDQLHLPDALLKQEGNKLFVVGQVPSKDDLSHVEQVLTAYPTVINLASVQPSPPPPPGREAPLVQLAVQVLEMSRTDLQKIGLSWPESVSFTEAALSDVTTPTALKQFGTSISRGSITATLNALVRKNRARLLAEPKLATLSGKTAESFLGGEVPILSTSSTGVGSGVVTTNIEFKKVGVKLKITPTVGEKDDRITTVMESEVSAIDTSTAITVSGIVVPGFKVRRAQSEFISASGETIIVAGLLQTEDTKAVDQVPALGSLPVLGRLFKSPEFQSRQTELVIAVTPELVNDIAKSTDKTMAVEQALSSSEVAASVDDPKLRYALQVQDRVAKSVRYPQREKELGLEGRVNLRLHLFSDGTLGKVLVAQSSGIEALDAEALKAAETQSPYPAFPTGLAQKDLWLDLPVIFRP